MFSNRKYVHFDENFTFSNSASLTSQITDFCNTVRKFTDYCFIHSLQRRHSWAIRYLFVRNVCNLDNFDKWVFFKCIMNEFNSFLSKAYELITPLNNECTWTFTRLFFRQSESVPTWMFLSWIPQLLANMNTENLHAIDSIIARITETYPQAMLYPYRLSRESFKMDNEHLFDIVQKYVFPDNSLYFIHLRFSMLEVLEIIF